jgi:UDP-glucose 4-epimerase
MPSYGSQRTIAVVGGAGYIGSHMTKRLAGLGHRVIVLDNLSTGYREAARFGELIVVDLCDRSAIAEVFDQGPIDAVMHFAGSSLVGESINEPRKYYRNNVCATLNLLDVMLETGVSNIVFSSTAAIFGNPQYTPIDEAHPKQPINPYGASKLMVERVLEDYAASYGLNAVSLRYFNACGADPDGELGESHDPETHLIPLILQAASGRRESISVFGSDYETPDGTCVRDYIHVVDLCCAHELALDRLIDGHLQGFNAVNLGNGDGYSVRDVIEAARAVVVRDDLRIKVVDHDRRAGDPATLVADARYAERLLGWRPEYTGLESMIQDAWVWEKKGAGIADSSVG